METLHKKHKDEGLVVIALEATGATAPAQEFINNNGLSYIFVNNGENKAKVPADYGVSVYPSTFLIDHHGKIVDQFEGFRTSKIEELDETISEMLKHEHKH